jgi:hypothetical protein
MKCAAGYLNSRETALGALERTSSSSALKTLNPHLQSKVQNFLHSLLFKAIFKMHFLLPIALSLASVAPLAAAFTLPAGLPSGNYAAYYNATGHEVHVRASELNRRDIGGYIPAHRAKRSKINVMEKRQDLSEAGFSVYCGCGFNLDHGNCDAAVAGLESQFPSTLDGGLAWYTIVNNVVVSIYQEDRRNQR